MKVLYRLVPEHTLLFRARYGPVLKGELPELREPVIVVGDASANFVLNNGIRPQVVIYDRICERRAVPKDMEIAINDFDVRELTVENPQGTVTKELIDALRQGISEKIKIMVKGEEDLAAVAVLSVFESGTLVYGLPGEGMTAVDIASTRKKLMPIIKQIISAEGK